MNLGPPSPLPSPKLETDRQKSAETTQGGFRFLANTYSDMMLDETANMEAYNFWAKKVRSRLHDPAVAEILAPTKPPHYFGAKRLSLEQDFYEQFNKPNIHVINIKQNPVTRVAPNGIVTSDGKLHELDVLALATGFDSITGGLKDIRIKGLDGEVLAEKWTKGTWTYLGLTTAGFPNFFFTYGPQGPTAFSNGPSCVEPQSDWIVKVLEDMRAKGLRRIDARKEAEDGWRKTVHDFSARSLRHYTDSWYMGSNIPGKPREPLNYAGGIPLYIKTINEVFEEGYKGFEVM
jgi:cation diffusion facilitator CzcD-associated flavoprotein CzcO